MPKKLTTEEFITKAVQKHGDKYDYSRVIYITSQIPIEIGCREANHGFFRCKPNHHLAQGTGCPTCAGNKKSDKDRFIQEAILVHGDKYGYSRVQYVNTNTKVSIFCKYHKTYFEQTPKKHKAGQGCPDCGRLVTNLARTHGFDHFVKEASNVHGNYYKYIRSTFVDYSTPTDILCTRHGIFSQVPNHHINKRSGCQQCYDERRALTQRRPISWFLEDARKVHGDTYVYDKVEYINQKTKVEILCKKHGSFWQTPEMHVSQRNGCPSCSHIISKAQISLEEFISSLGVNTVRNFRLSNKSEIDVYCPDLKLGFEYNGLYWHSDVFKPRTYHFDKTNQATSDGIRIIHIFEDEWVDENEKCKAFVRNLLGKETEKYNARDCSVSTIPWSIAKPFLDEHHLQSSGATATISYGLHYKSQLIAVMCFTDKTVSGTEIELIRFASKGVVRGGFSKLLKAFKVSNTKYSSIVSFSENRWSEGNVYSKNGFTFVGNTDISYWWAKAGKRYHKRGFQHQHLKTKFENYDPNKTESENCRANGYHRVWDCGKAKWRLDL